ncbi:hypothetical protein G7Z17_g8195 [Cylindrodendrum hubeiense]|uniref:Uncharacterized protein n=1 Tax=Cylindrodendrum hubeiense TaxID=595255 RepID=A0A9P5H2E6_9HYPO|nr:hypothetical protein G7Z17_g8195 [Cylindrodendrum hubeiense]
MNAPTNGGPPRGGPNAYRQTMDEWRQQALADRGQYEERVKAQINRSFQEYSPPWYASAVGFRRDRNLLVVTSRVSGFAATLGRDLEDSEAKAIAEYTLSNIHTNAALKWATIGLAAYMTYRGRRTWQFPFYKPKLGGRFNPNEATSIFTKKKIRGTYPRLTWHTLRFTAYAAVTMLMVEPVFRSVNFIRTESAMAQDPRLAQFIKEATTRVEKVMLDGPTGSRPTQPGQRKWGGDEKPGSNDEVDGLSNNEDKEQFPAIKAYTERRPPWADAQRGLPSPQNQESNNDWSVLDDDDDASPVAATAKNQQAPTTYAGSSWDRLRRQNQSSQRPQQQAESQARGGWAGASSPQSQPESGWGDNASASSEWGGSKDNYSYSSEDEEKASGKGQAQREFDEMLERERRGNDQSRQWGRK